MRKGTYQGLLRGPCLLTMHLKGKQYQALCTMPHGSACVCQIIMVITIFILEEDCSYSKNYVIVQTHCFPSLRFQLLKLAWIFISVVSGMLLATFFSLSFKNFFFKFHFFPTLFSLCLLLPPAPPPIFFYL